MRRLLTPLGLASSLVLLYAINRYALETAALSLLVRVSGEAAMPNFANDTTEMPQLMKVT